MTGRPGSFDTYAGTTRATISAVVPNYNYGAYVGDAIESLLNQSPPFAKVVVVNDGSTDDSMDVINRYRDAVQVIDIPNGGQLGACLEGLRHVNTDYVYFLDADDMAVDNFTQQITPLLTRRPAKVQFMLQAVDVNGVPMGSIFPKYPPGYTTEQIQRDGAELGLYVCAPTSGNVFRVERLRAMPLDRMRPRDFIDFTPNLMIAYMGEIVSHDQALTRYRVHGDNHSQTWVDMTEDRLERELEWFINSWAETQSFLPGLGVRPTSTVYVLERQMMLRVLRREPVGLSAAATFCLRVLRSSLSGQAKLLNLAWLALILASRGELRQRVMQAKRVPHRRPRLLNKLFWPQGPDTG